MAKATKVGGDATAKKRPTGKGPAARKGGDTPAGATPASTATRVPPRLKEVYRDRVVPALMKEFQYRNPMQVPRLDRVALNVGMGEAVQNVKLLESAASELSIISGQRAVVTKAKKSIASFKLRQGMPIGAKVTLRGDRMWEFIDRLVIVALRRIGDFRGVSPKAFDGGGN